LPPGGGHGRLPAEPDPAGPARPVPVNAITLLLVVAVTATVIALLARRFGGRHERAVSGVLDAADALEERLRTARTEIEAVVGDEQDPVRAAMREMLRQRLWLQEHASGASVAELQTVRDSIDAARYRIEHQLAQIERARAPLH